MLKCDPIHELRWLPAPFELRLSLLHKLPTRNSTREFRRGHFPGQGFAVSLLKGRMEGSRQLIWSAEPPPAPKARKRQRGPIAPHGRPPPRGDRREVSASSPRRSGRRLASE